MIDSACSTLPTTIGVGGARAACDRRGPRASVERETEGGRQARAGAGEVFLPRKEPDYCPPGSEYGKMI